ncbi:MAG: hypothetical protein H3C64_10320 [Candidatus Kuenenia stuttgartiensis]|uniref:Uncharacterized protein n=1 Tax=Kuenenia stuttgartiensis TaxID=174633 RepID=A0A2C9CGS3_KUEST|nr:MULTISPECIES: hypothetical protein [Kuenenia]MCZ7562408.1 hypothetical protein [Burkholderiales bacterium]MBW7942760.1 hypothetical protein [Candidatus Kuenenia stuttgartiensis]MCL4726981.1 hypothetical protein [Candidatus Kuenenia stuttgartiensis]MCZ7622994.1 hypothetical protein [Candidatus Kuenenia sp.]SOH04880.1 hypothetical protein KSMBR1_2392 [Candidatus Kuenenia stuttgartiensis]
MVKGFFASAIKKVTLELIYQVVDERTVEILAKIEEVRKRQEDDFRYLVQKIDTDISSIRSEMGQLRNEIKGETESLRGEIGSLRGEIKGETESLRGEIGSLRGEIGSLRNDIGQLNQRIDTIIQLLVSQKHQG